MLKHIVLLKLKSNYSKEEKEIAIKKIIEKLSELPNKIKEIKHYEIFRNIKEGSSDLGLIGQFETEKDLEKYRKHPAHIEILDLIEKHKEQITSIDYFNDNFSI